MAIRGDAKHRRACGERTPKSLLASPQAPAGLIDAHGRGGADAVEQLLIGRGKRFGRAPKDGVNRAGSKAGAEQLARQLHGVAAGDAVAHRQGGDCRLKTGAEGARGNIGRKLGAHEGATIRAAQAMQPMLAYKDGDRGQLGDLVTGWLAEWAMLCLTEAMAAATALGPVLDDLIHGLGRLQVSPVAFVTVLGAPFAAGRPGSLARRGLRWILAGRY